MHTNFLFQITSLCKQLYRGTDIGFYPTNQNTLYLLCLFYSDNERDTEKFSQRQRSNLHSHWLRQNLSVQFFCLDSVPKGFVKGEVFCFRYLDFYFRRGESTFTASQLTSPASQKSQDLNKVPLLLKTLGLTFFI